MPDREAAGGRGPLPVGPARDPRHDILFEAVRIGPLVARNRFYQVPHCNGMGNVWIRGQIAMRRVKAEGGWAVVNTEYCSADHASESNYPAMSLWDEDDVRAMAAIAEAVHGEGALMGVQIGDLGGWTANLVSREPPRDLNAGPGYRGYPQQARAMDAADIRHYLAMQGKAAARAARAGCDIVYVDAAGPSPPLAFVSARLNGRRDAYGGSLANRTRLLRQAIEATREAIGPTRAVAVRVCVNDLVTGELAVDPDVREAMELLAEVPDLWDVNVFDWENDSLVSRFGKEGNQEPLIDFVKTLTTKPVVGVGRFTSPDAMASQIRRGVLDFIGSARPSIADPFLPRKIEEGRADDIRECIGCNICVSGFLTSSPIRCTQNPTMGEEYRRGWHPERIAPRRGAARVLVVGAGPAGLEAALALGHRGYEVVLAEAERELGGRVARECRLPGLAEWSRVRDWRVHQIRKLANVAVHPGSRMSAEDAVETGCEHVVLATGARWRRDGVGAANPAPVEGWDRPWVISPDAVMDGAALEGPVVVFDDSHYYMGPVAAEAARRAGAEVLLITPAADVATFCIRTQEHRNTVARLRDLGVTMMVHANLAAIGEGSVAIHDRLSGRRSERPCRTLVMVTMRDPVDGLHAELEGREGLSVRRIGDCLAPGTIAAAVWSGHRYARELDEPAAGDLPYRRERTMP
jgi:dimethylamine/trimethylamine dehydrogenase